MKPAPFDYQAPGTLREAIDLLASNPEACVIAGGQSLMPVLAFRLATPSLLVDLRRLPGLGNIDLRDDGFRLGALVRWRDIEDDQRLASAHTLIDISTGSIPSFRNPCGRLTWFSTMSLGPRRASITSSPQAQPTVIRASGDPQMW